MRYIFGLFSDIKPVAESFQAKTYPDYYDDNPDECYDLYIQENIWDMMSKASEIVFHLESFEKDYDYGVHGYETCYTIFELFIALEFFRDKIIGPEWIFELNRNYFSRPGANIRYHLEKVFVNHGLPLWDWIDLIKSLDTTDRQIISNTLTEALMSKLLTGELS